MPRTDAPSLDKLEYTATEIAKLARVSQKTVYRWVLSGVLPPVPFRGRLTRYSLDHARRARAIALTSPETATHPRFPEMVPIILGEQSPPPAAPTTPATPQPTSWIRTVLAPGLELHLAAGAPPASVRLAAVLEATAGLGTTSEDGQFGHRTSR